MVNLVSEMILEKVAERRAALGSRLRALRVAAGMTQEQLATKCSLDRKTINRVEAGHHSVRLDNLWALADALGVPASALVAD